VLAHKPINSKKGNKLPEEVGLRLRKQPQAPKEMPITAYIRNTHGIRDWELFLS